MKNFLNSLIFCALATAAAAQEILKFDHACSFDGREDNREYYTHEGSAEANRYVDEILKTYVLESNFKVISGNCKNALATVHGGERYIMYNTTFLENFKKNGDAKWAAYGVMAHEIGHHLNNHDFVCADKNPAKCRLQEIKADQFAGGVLFRLGASLEEAQTAVRLYTLEVESASHPPRSARLEAFAVGWKLAQETSLENRIEMLVLDTSDVSNAKGWFNRAKHEKDIKKKVEYYTKAIELDSNYADAYNNRGIAKKDLGLHQEALKDYDKALLINPKFVKAYNNRGVLKKSLNKLSEAIEDYDKAIEIEPKYATAYNGRGSAKKSLGQFQNAISDFDRAIEFDPTDAKPYCNKGCTLVEMGKYLEAIEWLQKGLKLDPNLNFPKACLKEATSKL